MAIVNTSLKGKVALVTGGARGLAEYEALALAEAGAALSLIDIDLPGAKKMAQKLASASGVKAIALKCDITVPAEIQAAVDATIKQLGSVDILVNNAGWAKRVPLIETTLEDWNHMIDVNLKGAFLCTQVVARQMIKQGRGGKIVNIDSIAGKFGEPDRGAYCASKGGLHQITKVSAVEFGQYDIHVNGVGVGLFNAGMSAQTATVQPEFHKHMIGRTVFKRPGKPEEMGGITLFLASSASDYITGQTIYIDGGITIH